MADYPTALGLAAMQKGKGHKT